MAKKIETILKNFVHHVVALSEEDDPAGTGFHREFRVLREAQIQNKNEDRFPTEDGRKEENVKKNRYKDILPRDDIRVKLTEIPDEKGSDYINATFIEDVDGERGYIAAQGPMHDTVADFWRMLWQYNCEIVFMACKLREDGKAKCEKYWPEIGESSTFGDITVYTKSEEKVQDHFILRQLKAEKDGQTHEMTQFQYSGWPDHNIPSSPDVLRRMVEYVRNYRKKLKIPMVVHCSAGCGRTGTICAIDYGWTLLDRGMITNEFSMFEIIKSIREQRMSMVQTPDQYEYTYMVMKSLCNEWLVTFTVHDYENVTPTPPAPEEHYCNVDFPNDKNNDKGPSTDKRFVIAEPQKETVKHIQSAKPEPEKKLETQQAAPQVVSLKPKLAPKVDVPARNTANSSNQPHSKTGQLPLSPTSPPPLLPSKKNPPSNAANLDPHKTVITLGGGNMPPKITKIGSVGASSGKPQAPSKPTAAEALKAPDGMLYTETAKLQKRETEVVAEPKAASKRQVNRPAYENFELPFLQSGTAEVDLGYSAKHRRYNRCNLISYTDSSFEKDTQRNTDGNKRSNSDGEAPDIPKRNYKPEEISPGGDLSPSSTDAVRHNYNNVVLASSKPHPPPQQGSAATKPPSSTATGNRSPQNRSPRSRSPQHLSKSQSPSRPALVQPVSPQSKGGNLPRLIAQTGEGGGGHRVQAVPGMVSAIGGIPAQPVPMPRQGSLKSKGPAPLTPSNAIRRGPVEVQPVSRQPQNATSGGSGIGLMKHINFLRGKVIKGHPGLNSAPRTGQLVKARQKQLADLAERPARVKGPRPMPMGWTVYKSNQQGTYL